MNRIKKSAVAAGLTAGLIGGGAAGVVFGSPLLAGAQESSSTTSTVAPKTSTSDDKTKTSSGWKAKRTERLQATLKPLVDAKTITQAQADAVIKALEAATPERRDRMDRAFDRGVRRSFMGLDALSDVLGLTPSQIAEQIASGKTLAQIAETKGVSVQKVIDTLVNQSKTRLDEAVKAGRIDQAQADKRLAEIKLAITDGVNNGSVKGFGREGHFGGRHGGPGGPDSGSESGSDAQGD